MTSLGWGGVGGKSLIGGSDDDSTTATPPQAQQKQDAQPETPSWATPPVPAPTPSGKATKGKGKGKQEKQGQQRPEDDAPPVVPVASQTVDGVEPGPSQRQLNTRLDDVARREAAVRQREEHIKELEDRLREGGIQVKPKNWPKCKPILYHDIYAEIPTPNQPVCKAGYYCWMISVSAYIMNFLTVSIQFFMGQGTLACFIFAALAGVTGVFCSWWTVYQSLYAALQTNGGSFAYGKYFIHKSISILWALWTFIAPPIGSLACFVAGLFVMIDQFSVGGSKGAVGGTLSIINMVLWGLVLLLASYEFIWTFSIWKKGGGLQDLEDQQRNASTAAMVFQNDTVSNAAKRLFGGAPRDDGIKF